MESLLAKQFHCLIKVSIFIWNQNPEREIGNGSVWNETVCAGLRWKLDVFLYKNTLQNSRGGALFKLNSTWCSYWWFRNEPCSSHQEQPGSQVCLDWWNLWLPKTCSETAWKAVVGLFYPLKTFRWNSVALFVFPGIASSCVLRISDLETLAKCFCGPFCLLCIIHVVRRWIMLITQR